MSFKLTLQRPLVQASRSRLLTQSSIPRLAPFYQTSKARFSTSPSVMAEVSKNESGVVHSLTSKAEFDEFVTNAKGPLVLDAFAEWCGPCKAIAPQMKKFSEEYKNVKFYKFDVDKVPDVAQELGIRAMPTFIFYNNGEQHKTVVGANVKALETTVKELGGY